MLFLLPFTAKNKQIKGMIYYASQKLSTSILFVFLGYTQTYIYIYIYISCVRVC